MIHIKTILPDIKITKPDIMITQSDVMMTETGNTSIMIVKASNVKL